MTNPFLNRFNTIYRGSRVLIPFFSDLNTFYKKIVGTIFNEKINNLDARFLPRVGKFNGTDDNTAIPVITLDKDNATIALKTKINAGGYILAKDADQYKQYLRIIPTVISGESNLNNEVFVNKTMTVSTTEFITVIITFDNGSSKMYYNGALVDTETITNDLTIDSIGNDNISHGFDGLIKNISFWDRVITSQEITDYGNDIIPTSPLRCMYLTGQGSHEYDISGNNNHGTISGTGTHYDFNLEGSTRPNDVGYSIWRKAANPDIQVQFDINGAALSLTAGVNIPAGYSFDRNVPAGGKNHNIYESLVGFNEDKVADSELEIFDRSNATRQTATSRASLWYDGTDLATKSRYHITEIVDPNIYDTFFNTDYKNMVFGVVKLLGSVPILLKEFLNYANKKIGSALTKVTNYCGITNIYP